MATDLGLWVRVTDLVDHTWQNKNRIFPVQGPCVTVAAVVSAPHRHDHEYRTRHRSSSPKVSTPPPRWARSPTVSPSPPTIPSRVNHRPAAQGAGSACGVS